MVLLSSFETSCLDFIYFQTLVSAQAYDNTWVLTRLTLFQVHSKRCVYSNYLQCKLEFILFLWRALIWVRPDSLAVIKVIACKIVRKCPLVLKKRLHRTLRTFPLNYLALTRLLWGSFIYFYREVKSTFSWQYKPIFKMHCTTTHRFNIPVES